MSETLWNYRLRRGNNPVGDPKRGACLLDAVSWLEYGQLGDHPDCVCPVLAYYGRALNDFLPDEHRQKLRIFVHLLPGTLDPAAPLPSTRRHQPVVTSLERRRWELLVRRCHRIAKTCGWSIKTPPASAPMTYLDWAQKFGRYTGLSATIYDPAIAAFAEAIALGGAARPPIEADRLQAANRSFALASAA